MNYRITTFADDLIALVARTIIDDSIAKKQFPDLSKSIIILPRSVSKITPQRAEFHRELLEYATRKGVGALIPPQITTLQSLFHRHHSANESAVLDQRGEQLILASALYENRNLFADKNVWRLTDNLVDLFNEINELYFDASDDERLLQDKLKDLDDNIWNDDSKKILAVWHEWSVINRQYHSLTSLERTAFSEEDLVGADEHIYLCGIEDLTALRIHWANKLYRQKQLTFFSQDDSHPVYYPSPARKIADAICAKKITPPTADTPLAQFMAAVFTDSPQKEPFVQRAKDFSKKFDSPLQNYLSIFSADSFEQHAWGIYWAVKRWIEQKQYKKISIVCLDRKLARRIRAIFDRYGLVLQDYSGWGLSTTSSASVIANLLPDEKKPFDHNTLISLLRSPFCNYGIARSEALYLAEVFQKYLSKLDYLPANLNQLLDKISDKEPFKKVIVKIAGILKNLQSINESTNRPLSEYFEILFESLAQLNIDKRLSTDNAGKMLLKELHSMNNTARQKDINGDGYFWRSWITHTLEHRGFRRPIPQRGILLLNLQQARLWKSDAIIFAGLEENALPGTENHLLNENIRASLGLATHKEQTNHKFYLFRRLLESSDALILTYQRYNDGKFVPPSPWLEALQNFHKIAYGDAPIDTTLNRYADMCQNQAIKHNVVNDPYIPEMPNFRSAKTLWPDHLTASAYKTLMDCPYRFFVKYCLKLYSERRPARYLTDSVFGSYIHKILEETHSAMDKDWNIENKQYVLGIAEQIVDRHFIHTIDDNYVNIHWYKSAQKMMHAYIDWVIDFNAEHKDVKFSHELDETIDISDKLTLRGKIDCYIQSGGGHFLIDYKTGTLPTKKDIENGEDIQLAYYAVLKPKTQEAYYLSLKTDDTTHITKRSLSTYPIDDYRDKIQTRLETIYKNYASGVELNAWGNEKKACQWCDYGGLCRRTVWKNL